MENREVEKSELVEGAVLQRNGRKMRAQSRASTSRVALRELVLFIVTKSFL